MIAAFYKSRINC